MESGFSRVMYTGINPANGCAIMNDAYDNDIQIAKSSLAGATYINDTMIRCAEKAKADAGRVHFAKARPA